MAIYLLDPNIASGGTSFDYEWSEDRLEPEDWYDKNDLDSILGVK